MNGAVNGAASSAAPRNTPRPSRPLAAPDPQPRREPVEPPVGCRIEIEGVVQGVGFRPWIYRVARSLGLAGKVRNDDTGVTVEVYGPSDAVGRCVRVLEEGDGAPPASRLEAVRATPIPTTDAGRFAEFAIVESVGDGRPRLSIPADVATCERCLAEIDDPSDRRFGYPFTNCTDCGPRYTIATGLPYDRPQTTMAGFAQCPCCQEEYDDPDDRRFHAQPNACPVCGPSLTLLDAEGAVAEEVTPLSTAIATLRAGEIVAIEGLGGFHLACCASSAESVRRLRERKHRSAKPFAVMVRDVDAARRLAHIGDQEALWLERPERPILLVELRLDAPPPPDGVAFDEIAPGCGQIGLFLPYTPLHHLLLEGTHGALVMTSGNLADEPIVTDPRDAVRRLAGVADAFLVHDRPIAARCDDSVMRLHADGPVLLRRSRGFVPRALRLPESLRFERPTLGCGAQLKTAVCLGVEDAAYLGAHVGDLETLDTLDAYAESIDHLERLLGVRAEVLAHDLHPDFLSTRWAQRHAAERADTECVPVQHHHAHLAAVLAEHPDADSALAVTWDGFGLGSDGAAWGGEILFGNAASSRRVATLRPIALAGGDVAVREVWRLALALVDDAFEGEPPLEALALFSAIEPERIDRVRQLLRTGIAAPLAHGAGRLFDAVGALVLGAPRARYEAEIAMRLEQAAAAEPHPPYPFTVDQTRDPWLIDHRPTTRALVADLLGGTDPARAAARFHDTLVAMLSRALVSARDHASTDEPPDVVALTGGCLVNRRLADPLRSALEPAFHVLRPHHAPPGDGGISLGQAIAIAAATARGMGEPSCV